MLLINNFNTNKALKNTINKYIWLKSVFYFSRLINEEVYFLWVKFTSYKTESNNKKKNQFYTHTAVNPLPIASQRLLPKPGRLLSGRIVGFPMIHCVCHPVALGVK